MEVTFKEDMLPVANLQLLIQIRALLETQLQFLAELHAKDDEQVRVNMAWIDKILQKTMDLVMEDIYAKYGKVNIQDLLKDV